MGLTASGIGPYTLAAIVFGVVTVCTVIVAVVGLLIDKSAAAHEHQGGR